MPRIILFNKPFKVLTQFRAHESKATLAEFFTDPSLRAAGRLDFDSEGLLILSNDGRFIQRITNPRFTLPKRYLAQVEGRMSEHALEQLRGGLQLKDGPTRPAAARLIDEPEGLWPRDPPVRYRREIPTSWLELEINEGRNRQVRRMTAAVGHPTLRLIRWSVGDWTLGDLQPGEYRES